MKPKKKSSGILPIVAAVIAAIAVFWCAACFAQTPNLTISAGTASVGSGLAITSDSPRTWKRFAVTSGSSGGAWSIVSAEHGTGDDGGIYFYTLTVSAGSSSPLPGPGPVTPPAPVNDLPIGTLTTACTAAVAGIPADAAGKMADTYEALAKSIDTGVIVSPLQLQLATGTQFLANFDAPGLAAFQNLTTAVNGWLDAQQCAGRLTPDTMDKYAAAYHAIAKAIKPDTVTPPAASAKTPSAAGKSPCADGKCPTLAPQYRWRWRQ
jgi:hypothetical protein